MRILLLLLTCCLVTPLWSQTTSRARGERQSTATTQEMPEPEESHTFGTVAPLSKARLSTSLATPDAGQPTNSLAIYRNLIATTDQLLRDDQGYAALATLDAAQSIMQLHLQTLSGAALAQSRIEYAETLLSYGRSSDAQAMVNSFDAPDAPSVPAALQSRHHYLRARLAAGNGQTEEAFRFLEDALEAGLLDTDGRTYNPALSRELDPLKCAPEYAALRDKYNF